MKRIVTILIFMIASKVFGQETILNEGFETGFLPIGWTEQKVIGNRSWDAYNGGAISDGTPYPNKAYAGTKNARFFSDNINDRTRLITKKINLLGKVKPVLEFYLAQDYWIPDEEPAFDQLKIYFKNEQNNTWQLLKEYLNFVSNWQKQTILLDSAILTDNFYIAFEGVHRGGLSVCIDDVKIYETDVAARKVLKINAAQPFQKSVIAGSVTNPLLRVDLYVGGNNNSLILESLRLKSGNTNDNDINPNGVKLYVTTDTLWYNPVLIDSASFSGGYANFGTLNHYLNSGSNSLWICYDLTTTVNPGNILDCSVDANNIKINEVFFPQSALNPSGHRIIKEVIFHDDFENDNGWSLDLDFERAAPNGFGGYNNNEYTFGSSDPGFAYSGLKVLGNDLTGIGTGNDKGNYYASLGSTYKYAVSPEINCKNYKNIVLSFKRWLGIYYSHKAVIDISTDGGSSWYRFWTNSNEGGSITDYNWADKEYNISSIVDRKEQVKIRFGIGETGSLNISCGWNIDDFSVTGDFVNNDVGIVSWESPSTGCDKSSAEEIKVTIKNHSNKISPSIIPLRYSLDRQTYYYDTLKSAIPAYSTMSFIFNHKANLSKPSLFNNAIVETILLNDDDNRNNALKKEIVSLGTKSIPYSEDFEKDSIWVIGGRSNAWQYGKPNKPDRIKSAASGTKAFSTYLASYYIENDSSFLESPCINLAGIEKPIFEFKFKSELEHNKDGFAIFYKKDDASPWLIVPDHSYIWKWNWYNSNYIISLKSTGWDTTSTVSWLTSKQVLPDELSGQSSVKFRFLFMSDNDNNYEGVAIDDIKIYEAPADYEIVSIDSINNSCKGEINNRLWFSLKNKGIRPLTPKDTIKAGYKINSYPIVWESFTISGSIAADSIIPLQFTTPANDLNDTGTYKITIIAKDPKPGFYESNNDTARKTITIFPLPFSNLLDTLSSARLDTFKIVPQYTPLYKYTWPDNSHDSIWQNNTEGSYYVDIEINDPNGCSIRDSFFLRKLQRDFIISKASPVSSCFLDTNAIVSFYVKNIGSDTLEINEISNLHAYYKFNNETLVDSIFEFNQRLFPNDSVKFSFNKHLPGISAGDSLLVYYDPIALDTEKTNDTLKYKLNEFGFPSLDLGDSVQFTGPYYTLDAGAGFSTYFWADSSSLHNYKARKTGWHKVTVTDANNCPAQDSIYVELFTKDIKPVKLLAPYTNCIFEMPIKLKFKLVNSGTFNIPAGDSLFFHYNLSDSVTYSDTLKLTNPFLSKDTLEYEFLKTEDFIRPGDYMLKVVASTSGDMISSNDTLAKTIRIHGFPEPQLGNDTILNALQYLLKAKTGKNRMYNWCDGSTDSNLLVTQSGIYSVVVTDTVAFCFSTDTIQLTLNIEDASVSKVLSPSDNKACTNEFKKMKVELKNTGNLNYSLGQFVRLGYVLNATTKVDTIILENNWQPGQIIEHTFTGINLNEGVHKFKLFITSEKDINTTNDTLFETIEVFQTPYVDLGGGISKEITAIGSYLLEAQDGTGYTFLWNDSSTNRTRNISQNEFCKVTVTEPNGCKNVDSVNMIILEPNVKVISKVAYTNFCIDALHTLKMLVKNNGNTLLPINHQITYTLSFISDGIANTFTEIKTLDKIVNPGDTFEYILSGFSNYLSTGFNSVKVHSKIKDDISLADTFSFGITMHSLPYVELENGNDTVLVTAPYVLDPQMGIGYNYWWNTSETTEQITINKKGNYSLKITDKTTNCSSSDSVYVKIRFTDLAIDNISYDTIRCLGDFGQVKIKIRNAGNTLLPQNAIINLAFTLNELSSSRQILAPYDLLPGQVIEVPVAGLAPYFKEGMNNLTLIVSSANDTITSNNTLKTAFLVNRKPELSLSSGGYNVSLAPPYTLISGSDPGLSYSWNTGENTRIIHVGSNGKYKVVATDNNTHCSSKDSVNVVLQYYDGSLSTNAPSKACEKNFEKLEVIWRNSGLIDFPIGTIVEFALKIDTSAYLKEQLTLNTPLNINDSIIYIFSGLEHKMDLGVNSFKVYASTPSDTSISNDTIEFSVTLYSIPEGGFSNGKDTIFLYPPYTLQTSYNEYYKYNWNDLLYSNSIQASQPGMYYLSITDTNTSCFINDSAYIFLETFDGKLVKNQISSYCKNEFDSVSVYYKNISSIPLNIGAEVEFAHSINETNFVKETVFLAKDLQPGDSLLHWFKGLGNNAVIGNNLLKLHASNNQDINKINDTIIFTLSIHDNPVADFTAGKDSIKLNPPYILNAVYSPDVKYNWNSISGGPSFSIVASGEYHLFVENTITGCIAKDSAIVTLVPYSGQLTVANYDTRCAGMFDTIQLSYKNKSEVAIAAGSEIEFSHSLNMDNPVKESIILSSPLEVDDSITYTFRNLRLKTLSGLNIFRFGAEILYDTLSQKESIDFSIQIYNNPDAGFSLGKDTVYLASPFLLSGGNNSSYQYKWNDSIINQDILVFTSGSYKLEVFDPATSCRTIDSAFVQKVYFDGQLSNHNASRICVNEFGQLNFKYTNVSKIEISAGTEIIFAYKNSYLNEDFVVEKLIIEQALLPNTSITKIFGNIHVQSGLNNFTAYAKTISDNNSSNDTLYFDILVNEITEAGFSNGNDSLELTPPFLLSGGNNAKYEYLWNNIIGSRIISISSPGLYKLEVKDPHTNCHIEDSAFINMIYYDGQLALNEIQPSCSNTFDSVSFVYKNTGSIEIPAGTSIKISYSFNNYSFVSKDIILHQKILAGEYIEYTLDGLAGYKRQGENSIIAFASLNFDNNALNDTVQKNFIIYDAPEISLYNGQDTVNLPAPYELMAPYNDKLLYNWNSGDTGNKIKADNSGNYIVYGQDITTGCKNSDSIYVSLMTYDAAISILPVTPSCEKSLDSVQVIIENTGKFDFPENSSYSLELSFDNAYTHYYQFTFEGIFASKQKITKTISGIANKLNVGNNQVKAVFVYEYDTTRHNDTAFENVQILALPNVSIMDEDTIYVTSSTTIEATSKSDVNYKWNNGVAGKKLIVSQEGSYIITVTDKVTQCFASDSIFVEFVLFDGGVISANFAQPACSGFDQTLEIEYKNVSPFTLDKNSNIKFEITINNKNAESFFYKNTKPLLKNESIIISYTINKGLLKKGSNAIQIVGQYSNDPNKSNDTLNTSLNVANSPAINLAGGAEQVSFTTSYELDAGSGFSTYKWNTGESKSSITVTTAGTYYVTVTNLSGCSGSDTIKLVKANSVPGINAIAEFTLYPVPTSDWLNIQMDKLEGKVVSINIYTTDQKAIYHKKTTIPNDKYIEKLRIENWKSGIYYIRIKELSSGREYNSRFMVK